MNVKFGIIIAFYNPKINWVKRCLDSIFNNEYENFEIVMIDDGSENECSKKINMLIDNYDKQKIKTVRIEHSGNSFAKSKGYEYLSNDIDYVWYIDSDDYIKHYAMKSINDFLTKNKNIDVLNFDFEHLYHSDDNLEYHIIERHRRRSVKSSIINLSNFEFYKFKNKYFFINEWDWSCCLSVYSKKFLDTFSNNPFYSGKNKFEDMFNNITILPYAKKIAILNKPFYVYWKNNSQSISNTEYDFQYALAIIDLFEQIIEDKKENNSRNFNELISSLYIKIIIKKMIFLFTSNINIKEKIILNKKIKNLLKNSKLSKKTKQEIHRYYKNHSFNYPFVWIKKIATYFYRNYFVKIFGRIN